MLHPVWAIMVGRPGISMDDPRSGIKIKSKIKIKNKILRSFAVNGYEEVIASGLANIKP